MGEGERSYLAIDLEDLQRLAEIARADREELFTRNAHLARCYRDRVICVALCQGAALHFVDTTVGINDFDVWTFFRAHEAGPFPPRRRVERDFGNPKFGRSSDRPDFDGKRVDLIGRSIPAACDEDPASTIQHYLVSQRTRSARCLAEKALIFLEPGKLVGKVVWNKGAV